MAERRAKKAETATGDIVIAVVDSRGEFSFASGVQLALEEVNAQGGVLRRNLRVLTYNDADDLAKGQRIANEISRNHDVIAVIGHNDSSVAISTSVTYHRAGLLFLSPEANDPALTRHRLSNTFRNTLTSDEAGRQLAEFGYRRGFRNMVILYQRTDAMRRLSEVFHARAIEQGINIIARRSYSHTDESYSELIAEIKDYKIDAIFLAGEAESAANIIQQSRIMGFTQPFMGGESLDTSRLWQIAGKAVEGTLVSTLFNPKLPNKNTQEFVKRFEARFGVTPNTWDAQGYDALHLIVYAIEKSGTTVPSVLATTLRFLEKWASVSGTYSFLDNGDITDRTLFFKEVRNSKFEFLTYEKLLYQVTSQTLQALQAVGMPEESLTALRPLAAEGTMYEDERAFLRVIEDAIGSERTARYHETLLHYTRSQKPADEIDPLYEIESTTLRLPLEDTPKTLDPALDREVEIARQLFLALTAVNPENFEALPELTSWEIVSPDRRVYEFRLRPDVYWTDGVPVTAEDVVWTIRRNVQPEIDLQPPEIATMLYPIVNARAIREGELDDPLGEHLGVRVIDNATVEFTLEAPIPYFPVLTASDIYRPLPRHVINVHGEAWAEPEHLQTNGPYKIERWYKEMVMILRKNPRYYNAGRVAIPEIRLYSVSNEAMGMTMYRENKLDLMGGSFLSLPFDEIPAIQANPALQGQYSVQPASIVWFFGFNTSHPPVDNPLVRKAIAAALDRQLFTDLITSSSRRPSTTITPPSVFGAVAPSDGVGIPFNPLKAREWLAEAGYPNGEGFPEIGLLTPVGTEPYRIAIRTFLKHYLNIDVVFETPRSEWLDMADYWSSILRPDGPEMFLYGYEADYPDADNFLRNLFHPASPNAINTLLRWENQGFDTAVEAALQTEEIEKRQEFYRQAEKIVCQDDVAVIPFFYDTIPVLIKPRVKGVKYNPIGGQDLASWSLAEE